MLLRIAGVLAVLLIFTYAGYPALAFALSKLIRKKVRKGRADHLSGGKPSG